MRLSRVLTLLLFLIPVSVIGYAISAEKHYMPAPAANSTQQQEGRQSSAVPEVDRIVNEWDEELDFTYMVTELRDKRVIFVGEQHTRMDHHLLQLKVLKSLHRYNAKIGIGVEWFQQGFQNALDDYVLGKISETEMLRRTEYYKRWKFDYRLYRPILEFARGHQLPIIALNAPMELTSKVSKGGLESLSQKERERLPVEILPPPAEYREHLQRVFENHEMLPAEQIERFMTVQRIWDESMADNSAAFLQVNPDAQLVVFSGVGHISHDAGIPADLQRRMPGIAMARVFPQSGYGGSHVDMAEFIVDTAEITLPETGKLGVWLADKDTGVSIVRTSKKGAAARAGIKRRDVISQIDGQTIVDMLDLKMAMDRKVPGDSVELIVMRGEKEKFYTVVLE